MEKKQELGAFNFNSFIENNNKSISKIEEFKNQKITTLGRNLVFLGIMSASVMFIVLFGLKILTSVLALVMSILLVVATFFGLRFLKAADPLVKMKMKNYVLKGMIEEVKKNSSTMLDRAVLDKANKIEEKKKLWTNLKGLVSRMENKVGTTSSEKIKEEKQKAIDMHKENLLNLESIISRLSDDLKHFKEKVADYKDKSEFNEISKEADALFASSGEESLQEMLTLEAFEQIDRDFEQNMAKAEANIKFFNEDAK